MQQSWLPQRPTVYRPDSLAAAFSTLRLDDTPGPMARTEHVGPVSELTLWDRGVATHDLDRMLEIDRGHTVGSLLGVTFATEFFDRPTVRDEDWGEAPLVPGATVLPSSELAMLGGDGPECAVCRFANVFPGGDILPLFTVGVDAQGHRSELTAFSNNSIIPGHPGVDEWRLFANGDELPQQSLAGLFPFYQLPSGKATYRLTEHFEDAYPRSGFGTTADTTWTFASQTPTDNQIPDGYDSLGVCMDTCRVEPLMFLRYQLDLGADNRLPAPGGKFVTVTAYRQPSTAPMPPVAGLRLWTSFDSGTHWRRMPVIPMGHGRFGVIMVHPPLRHGSTGSVSLKTEAWDTAGNRIVQVLPNAYGLVSHHWWPRTPR